MDITVANMDCKQRLELSVVTDKRCNTHSKKNICIQCRRYKMHIQQVSSLFFSFHGIWVQNTHQDAPVKIMTLGSVSPGQWAGNMQHSLMRFQLFLVDGRIQVCCRFMKIWTPALNKVLYRLIVVPYFFSRTFRLKHWLHLLVHLNTSLINSCYSALLLDHLHSFIISMYLSHEGLFQQDNLSYYQS